MGYKHCRECKERQSLVEHGIFTCHDFCKAYLEEKKVDRENRVKDRTERCSDYLTYVSDMKTLGKMMNDRMRRRDDDEKIMY